VPICGFSNKTARGRPASSHRAEQPHGGWHVGLGAADWFGENNQFVHHPAAGIGSILILQRMARLFAPAPRPITDGTYAIYQNENYVTVKAPNPTYAGDTQSQWASRTDSDTGIKGDNAGHDVADVRANILSTVANFPSSTSVDDPADALLANSFILPEHDGGEKPIDGVGLSTTNPIYNSGLRTALIGSSYATNFPWPIPAR